MPARTGRTQADTEAEAILQWRGGHVPARTRELLTRRHLIQRPSMEGRARARPDPGPRRGFRRSEVPSMEGRARARPDQDGVGSHASIQFTFNGGAGTCPPGPWPC